MLTVEQNERLTQVGPGTPMGELLRRYWYPVATSTEIGRFPLRRRLLGQEIVVYRDADGTYGSLDPACPHRGASLEFAALECGGIRCAYHGWKFDETGQCLEQPAEPPTSRHKDGIRARAYPTQELGGLVWVYLGPHPAPLLPRYDLFVWEGALREIGQVTIPCNFVQIMENSVDPYHVEWLHGRFADYVRNDGSPTVLTNRTVKVGFDTFEYGIIKRRLLEGETEEDEGWSVGHPLVFPNLLRIGAGGYYQFQIRVPLDDHTTHHYWYTVYRPENVVIPPQQEIPLYDVPLHNPDGSYALHILDVQDIVMWMSQGPVTSRPTEHLVKSDVGIVHLRRLYQSEMAKVDAGQDPICVIRDPARNDVIDLPQEHVAFGSGESLFNTVSYHGQMQYSPIVDHVRALFEQAYAATPGATRSGALTYR
jgi:5,5'-dehydrodivanillate O-demethylase oxygenase subunit